jgi:hypothetical protein
MKFFMKIMTKIKEYNCKDEDELIDLLMNEDLDEGEWEMVYPKGSEEKRPSNLDKNSIRARIKKFVK